MNGLIRYDGPERAPEVIGAQYLDILTLAQQMYAGLPLVAARPEWLLAQLSANPDTLALRRDMIQAICDDPELERLLTQLCIKMEQWAELPATPIPTGGYIPLDYTLDYQPLCDCLQLLDEVSRSVKRAARCEGIKRMADALDELDAALQLSQINARSREIMSGIERIGSFKFELELDDFLRLRRYRLLQINDYTYKPDGSHGKLREDTISGDSVRMMKAHNRFMNVGNEQNGITTPTVAVEKLGREVFRALHYTRMLRLEGDSDMATLINAGANNGSPNGRQIKLAAANMLRQTLAGAKAVSNSMLRRISAGLKPIREGLSLALGCANLTKQLKASGLPLCYAGAGRGFKAEKLWLPQLLRAMPAERVVSNSADLGEGRGSILTGANEGGKTTYLRSVGVAAVMNALGLPVCAESAQIRNFGSVVCVFSDREDSSSGDGRIVQELRTMAGALESADADSLVLLNEPITATCEADAETISESVLEKLRRKGACGLFVTHLHPLAEKLYKSGNYDCLTALCADGGVTYRVRRQAPEGSSHAYDAVARRMPELMN